MAEIAGIVKKCRVVVCARALTHGKLFVFVCVCDILLLGHLNLQSEGVKVALLLILQCVILPLGCGFTGFQSCVMS